MRDLFRRQPRFTAEPTSKTGPTVPDDLWVKCPRCGELVYSREFARLYHVCPRCTYHGRLTARQRIDLLADAGSFVEWDAGLTAADPLEFVANGESYREKAVATARKAGSAEALMTGATAIGGHPVALAVAEFGFLGASMGSVFGEKLVRAIERAVDHGWGLVSVSSSGGARMHESPFSLMQMAKTTAALARLGAAGLVHLAVVADPCMGGVTASYVTVADVIVAEPGAMIGFAGARVIEQITRQKLPEGFQTSEFQLAHGMIDLIVPRRSLAGQLATLLGHYAAAPVRAPRAPSDAVPEVAGA